MNFLADESYAGPVVRALREAGHVYGEVASNEWRAMAILRKKAA